jgi:multiple sugar transport system substrate-binding protein
MMGAAGNAMVVRKSMMNAAGFEQFPTDMPGFMKLCQALKAKNTPAGFALGNATGDASWTSWLVWAFGGKLVDEHNKVVINSPQTLAALEYAKELYPNFIPGTLSWLDPNNNKAFLDGQLGLTANGISVYFAAKNSQDPKMKEIAADIIHAKFPNGIDGKAAVQNLVFPMMIFKYSKYPNAAKEYLRFMMEKEQYVPWQEASIGYVCHPLAAYESSAFWTADPKVTPYRDCMKDMRNNGYAGTMGYASAQCSADFIIPNMVAEAASGAKSPKEAMERAQQRAERYYKI